MATEAIAAFTKLTALAEEPFLIDESKTSPGGVDPLGLRQINFRLMDDVLIRLEPGGLRAWDFTDEYG